MNYPEERQLFTIKEFSRACGVSRTSLIRMEECGFLTPYRTDPDTGYRYYDAHNAAEVGQFQLLQTLGLPRGEIADYYFQKKDAGEFLQKQREKLTRMQRIIEELELRSDSSRQFMFSFIDLPETVCFCRTADIASPLESELFFYTTHEECIREGYHLQGTEPMFGLSEDYFRFREDSTHGHTKTSARIPIVYTGGGDPDEDPNLITFPAVHAFSALAHGDYSIITELCTQFWQEIEARKIQPAGPARFIGLVAPYTGRHIEQKQFCYRLIVPVESDKLVR